MSFSALGENDFAVSKKKKNLFSDYVIWARQEDLEEKNNSQEEKWKVSMKTNDMLERRI